MSPAGIGHIRALVPILKNLADWTEAATEGALKAYVESAGLKMGDVAQPLRAALTGQAQSPSLYEIMAALGREETFGRLADAAK